MMKTRYIVLAVISGIIIFAVAAWLVLVILFDDDPVMVDIATDKNQYRVGETVRIHIENYDHQDRDLYCPLVCALGNFPTTIEKINADGEAEYLATFCPSVEPLFGDYETRNGYIIHPLAPGDSYDLVLVNTEALSIQKPEQVRIVYYLNAGKSSILSAPFTITP